MDDQGLGEEFWNGDQSSHASVIQLFSFSVEILSVCIGRLRQLERRKESEGGFVIQRPSSGARKRWPRAWDVGGRRGGGVAAAFVLLLQPTPPPPPLARSLA